MNDQAEATRKESISIATIAPLAATASAALVGVFYLAGYAHRDLLLQKLGIPLRLVDESFADTVARGYLDTALHLILVAICGILAFCLTHFMFKSNRLRAIILRTGQGVRSSATRSIAFLMALGFMALFFGYMSGVVGAAYEINRLSYYIDEYGYSVTTPSGTFKGWPIVADRERVIYKTRNGVIVVKASDVLLVRRPDKRSWIVRIFITD